jgi:hypothetical protein
MLALLCFLLQLYYIVHGIRQEEKAGVWSWSKFVFVLGFALLEWLLLMAPYYVVPPHSRYFTPLLITCCSVAALNFIGLILICRRWRLPDGRTSLQAFRDNHPNP